MTSKKKKKYNKSVIILNSPEPRIHRDRSRLIEVRVYDYLAMRAVVARDLDPLAPRVDPVELSTHPVVRHSFDGLEIVSVVNKCTHCHVVPA